MTALRRPIQSWRHRSGRPGEGAVGHSVERELRIIGWIIEQKVSPTRAQQIELALEAVSLIRRIVLASTNRLRMDESRMGSEDDTLAGFAQPQAIINIVESNAEIHLVHAAHL